MVTINISQSNVLENITSEIIKKMYDVAIDPNNTVTFAGNLYSPSGYAAQVEYLRNAFSPDLTITVPENGLFISFEDSAVESVIKTFLGISNNSGVTVGDAANATFTSNTFKNNTTITSFNEFPYFTKANTNPPQELFRGCTNLTQIDLTETTTISNNEFLSSGITEINAPSLGLLGTNSFAYCTALTTITDLGNITSIPTRAFQESYHISSVNLPSSVTNIEATAFYAHYLHPNTSLAYIDLSNVTNVGNDCFTNNQALHIDVSMLSNIVSIGISGFDSCYLLYGELNMPNLMSLGNYSFRSCGLITKIKCLGKITSIPENFIVKHSNSSANLSEVYIPYECTSIGVNGFYGNNNLTTIKQYTLSVDNWVEGETPTYGDITRVTSFGNSCFEGCSSLLLSTSAIANATTISGNAFKNCKLLNGVLDLPNLTSLGSSSFEECTGLTGVTYLGSITSIPAACFRKCTNLTSVNLPSTCISIKDNAFYGDSSLTTIDLSSITLIEGYAFRGCTSLSTVTSMSNVTSIGVYAFWNTNLSNINIPSATTLGSGCFSDCKSLTTVTSLGSITSIPADTFKGCTNLNTIKLPTTVTTLGKSWGRGISDTLHIYGLDNVSAHGDVWTLTNVTILNPIKTSLITGSNIVDWSDKNKNVRLHSIYEPLRTSTLRNSEVKDGLPGATHFVYSCLGGSGSFTIGLLYYRDIISFGDATFFRCNIENLVINNITPPTLNNSNTTFSSTYYWLNWGNSIFGNLSASSDVYLHDHAIIGTLWVPDSAVATYQADPLYSSLTIKGINTKTNGVDYDLPRYADFAAWEAAEEAAVAQGGHAPQGLIEAWM